MIPKDLGYISVIGTHQPDLTYSDATIVNKMYGCGITASKTPCYKRPCTDLFSASTCKKLGYTQSPGNPHTIIVNVKGFVPVKVGCHLQNKRLCVTITPRVRWHNSNAVAATQHYH